MMKKFNLNINKYNNINEENGKTRFEVNEIYPDEPKHYKSLKYHSDTISQIIFNTNK